MKRLLLLLLISSAAVGGWWLGRHNSVQTAVAPTERKILYYQSPMHPWIKSDQPGNCTICGMQLAPIYEGEKGFDAKSGAITLSGESIHASQVETSTVERRVLQRTLRVAGMIDDDDSSHRRLSAYVDGRIEKLYINSVGAEVEAGQPLAEIYSPTLLTARNEVRLLQTQASSPERDRLLEVARSRLRLLGLAPSQIESLSSDKTPPGAVPILAPISGTVVARNVYEGQYVKEGEVLFEVADFSKMWFVFDAYERDLQWIRMGDTVEITTSSQPGKIYTAPIKFIDPNLNPETRSAKVRVILDNPHVDDPTKHRHELLHKLYAEGRIHTESLPTLTIPRSAVLWPTGKPVVYVVNREGSFEPREVQLGRVGDDLWEVSRGLSEGERVVTTGNLLIDSQAQIQQSPKPAVPVPEVQIPVASRQPAQDFLSAVGAVSDALAVDDFAGFKAAVPQAVVTSAVLSKTLDEPGNPRVIGLEKARDLTTARSAFFSVGEYAADLALRLRRADPGFEDIKVFRCDMARSGVPDAPTEFGRWVQTSNVIKNPWLGLKMQQCGEEVKP